MKQGSTPKSVRSTGPAGAGTPPASMGHETGCPAASGGAPAIQWEADPAGLDADLLVQLGAAAREYQEQTNRVVRVTSARRSLRRQAELMAAMTRTQLEGMYCRNGYPEYIRQLVTAAEAGGPISAEQAYDILRKRADGFISSHLYGGAVDLDTDGLDVDLLRSLLVARGFSCLDERNLGIACLHATYRTCPVRVIRE